MKQLIKQIFLSFKKSFLLLFGLVFIVFAIVFTTISSLYLSSNLRFSIANLSHQKNASDVILPVDFADNNLEFDLSEDNLFTIRDFSNRQSAYENNHSSFAYQPKPLIYSAYSYQPGYYNYIFPYTAKDFNTPSLNDPNQLYFSRKRGVLKAYSDTNIDISNPSSWRGYSISFTNTNLKAEDNAAKLSDPKYISYYINPLTGNNLVIDGNYVTQGYFSDGLYTSTIQVFEGYITNPVFKNGENGAELNESNRSASTNKNSVNSNLDSDIFQHKFEFNSNTDNQKETKFTDQFYTKSNAKIWASIDFNNLSALASGSGITAAFPFLGNGPGTVWIESSNLEQRQFSGLYDVVDAIRKNVALDTNNSFVFNLALNLDSLSPIQKQILDQIRNNNFDNYLNLTKSIYSIRSDWLLEKIKEKDQSYKNKQITDFQTLEQIKNDPIAKNVLLEWINKYASNKASEVKSYLAKFQKDYVSSKLSQYNIEHTFQKSFTITDSNSGQSYLVNQKDNTLINQVAIVQGINLVDSAKDVENYSRKILEQVHIPSSRIAGINPNGLYYINLLRFITNAKIPEGYETNAKYLEILKDAKNIIESFDANQPISHNDYYKIFSYLNPNDLNQENIRSDQQSISFGFGLLGGVSTVFLPINLEANTPYAKAVVVSPNWLEQNKKAIVDEQEWKNIINQKDPNAFDAWFNKLDDKYKLEINVRKFAIIGTGISPENAFPVVAIDKPFPDPKTQAVVFANKQAYDAILNTLPSSHQDQYFAIQSKRNLTNKLQRQGFLKEVNAIVGGYKSESNNKAFLTVDYQATRNSLAFRSSYPYIVSRYVSLISVVLISLLVVSGIYLSFLLLKTFVEKNQVQLAIIKANGFSTSKIGLSICLIGLIASSLAGICGFIVGYLMQNNFLSFLDSFWFIERSLHSFSLVGFFSSFGIVALAFFCITIYIIQKNFKKPISELIAKNADIKINKFLNIFKSSRINFNVLYKFRLALTFSNLSKFFVFILLATLGISLSSLAFSIPHSFSVSNEGTQKNRNYSYKFELNTPTEQSGLYKLQSFADIGISDPSLGINSIYSAQKIISDNLDEKASTNIDLPYRDEMLLLRDLNGNVIYEPNGKPRTFSNFLLPSYGGNLLLLKDVNFFRNAVFSKWLLDFNLNVVGLSINPWSLVKTNLPSQIVAKIDAQSNNFLAEVVKNPILSKINEIGNGTEQNKKPFIRQNQQTGIYELVADNVFNPINITDYLNIRLNDNFLKFVGMVYGNEELSAKDVKISYGIVPINNQSETYTYIDGSVVTNRRLANTVEKITGIKSNSDFVVLYDENNNKLNHLLDKVRIENDVTYYAAVINKGAAFKYGLKVGDKFQFNATNTYDRLNRNWIGESDKKLVNFYVAGINTDAFQQTFYTSQHFANLALGLDFSQGARIIAGVRLNNPDKRIQKVEDIKAKDLIYDEITTAPKVVRKLETNAAITLSTSYAYGYDGKSSTYIPFNGVFSIEKDPKLISNNLSFITFDGLHGNYETYSDSKFLDLINASSSTSIWKSVLPNNLVHLKALAKKYELDAEISATQTHDYKNQLVDLLVKKFPSGLLTQTELENVNKTSHLSASLVNYEDFKTIFNTFNIILDTLINAETFVLGIFIPIIILIVFILTSLMNKDFAKIITILKVLGLSDKDNIRSLAFSFGLITFFAAALALLLIFFFSSIIQLSVFNFSAIFISKSINWLSYLYGFLIIFVLLLVNFIFSVIGYKRANLGTSVKA